MKTNKAGYATRTLTTTKVNANPTAAKPTCRVGKGRWVCYTERTTSGLRTAYGQIKEITQRTHRLGNDPAKLTLINRETGKTHKILAWYTWTLS